MSVAPCTTKPAKAGKWPPLSTKGRQPAHQIAWQSPAVLGIAGVLLVVATISLLHPPAGDAAISSIFTPHKAPDISTVHACLGASGGHVHQDTLDYTPLAQWLGLDEEEIDRALSDFTDVTTLQTLAQLLAPGFTLVLDPMLYLHTRSKALGTAHGFPKLIHMTMRTKRAVSPQQVLSILSWGRLHPGYTLLLYDDHDMTSYMRTYYPQFLHTYYELRTAVERADAWRYHALCGHGGIYTDTDTIATVPMEDWVKHTSASSSAAASGAAADAGSSTVGDPSTGGASSAGRRLHQAGGGGGTAGADGSAAGGGVAAAAGGSGAAASASAAASGDGGGGTASAGASGTDAAGAGASGAGTAAGGSTADAVAHEASAAAVAAAAPPGEPSLVVGVENRFHTQREAELATYVRKIQLVQWTIAAKRGHPALCGMGEAITKFVEKEHEQLEAERKQGIEPEPEENARVLDASILLRTGPGLWTDEVERYLQQSVHKSLEQLAVGGLAADVLVLPQTALGCSFRFWQPSNTAPFVYHMFNNSWKLDNVHRGGTSFMLGENTRAPPGVLQWMLIACAVLSCSTVFFTMARAVLPAVLEEPAGGSGAHTHGASGKSRRRGLLMPIRDD